MKNTIYYIDTTAVKGGRIPLCFNLNVMEEIQEVYGSIEKWGNAVSTDAKDGLIVKDFKAGLLAMINEAIDMENMKNEEQMKQITSKELGRIVTEVGFEKIVKIIQEITVKSTKTGDEPKNE